MRTSSANVHNRVFDIEDLPSVFDTAEFQVYMHKIEKIVTKVPMPVRAIHDALGDEANSYWTLDAIEQSPLIEVIKGALYDKYIKRKKQVFIESKLAPMGISPKAFEQD